MIYSDCFGVSVAEECKILEISGSRKSRKIKGIVATLSDFKRFFF